MNAARVVIASLLAGGCVATNPRWDGPTSDSLGNGSEASSAGAEDTSDDGSGEASTGFADSVDPETGSATTGPGAGPGPDSTAEPPMMCPGMEMSCDGECRNVEKDKHHCGPECLDCDELFDGDGACEQGVCVDKDEGDG